MKRAVTAIIVIILIITVLALPASAADYTVKYGACAEELWAKGLFQGTGTSFDLDKPLTRAAGVTMMVRLLGRDDVSSKSYTTPFTDLPDWALGYVGYAYVNGLTNGTGERTFAPNSSMPAAQFLTLVLRALGYDDSKGDFSWDKAEEKAIAIGLTKGGEFDDGFLRDHAAYVCLRALDTVKKGTTTKLRDTIAMPGQPETGNVPSPSQNEIPTGRVSLGAYSRQMTVGETQDIDLKVFLGNSVGAVCTLGSTNKSAVTVAFKGDFTKSAGYAANAMTLAAVGNGTSDIYIRVFNKDKSIRYQNVYISVTVGETKPSPSPTPTVKPTPIPVPTTDPSKLPFSFQSTGTELYCIPGMEHAVVFEYRITGGKGFTVELAKNPGTCYSAFEVAPTYNEKTGVTSGRFMFAGTNETSYTAHDSSPSM